MTDTPTKNPVEQWGTFEAALAGPAEGNPFLDVTLAAAFRIGHRAVEVGGFYDGEGVWRVRFMPDMLGRWTWTTRSSHAALAGRSGTFECTEPSPGNHGPVRVRNTFHFAYADGTPYRQIGTTCYAWNHQSDELEARTLETLKAAPFNKLRMCLFPKHYEYCRTDPPRHAFEAGASGGFDLARLNPDYFRHLELRIGQLRELGIEADLILFHPYDRWGYAAMPAEADGRVLRYVVARLAAYRNVWWSFANEYDLMKAKSLADWDRMFCVVQASDPSQHLRSIHNCREFYDHAKPWVTHCSVQHGDLGRVAEWRRQYRKPVVVDECCYEGDIHNGWGNITARELVHRFWTGTAGGGYVGHGETYYNDEEVLWWSKGGVLRGDSPPRLAFLRQVLDDGPPEGLDPVDLGGGVRAAGRPGEYYLAYLGDRQPAWKVFRLPADATFRIDVIDAWEMTITPVAGTFSGETRVELPGRPYVAVRIRRA